MEEHCTFDNKGGMRTCTYRTCLLTIIIAGVVTIVPTEGGTTYVNGTQIFEPKRLTTGSRIILGNNHVFRYNNPDEGMSVCVSE